MEEVKHEDCEVKPDIFSNPWLVQSYDEFLYYCCPECNYKCQQHEEFSSHAVLLHPLVCQSFLCKYGLHPFSFDIFGDLDDVTIVFLQSLQISQSYKSVWKLSA